jgi:hypothetical protein
MFKVKASETRRIVAYFFWLITGFDRIRWALLRLENEGRYIESHGTVPMLPTRSWESQNAVTTQFLEDNFFRWMVFLKENPRFHTKQWQYYAILECALEVSNSRTGNRAMGFGVGTEPLPAALAKIGFDVHATDYFDGDNALQWAQTGQMSSDILKLNDRRIIEDDEFLDRVRLSNLDMNEIPVLYNGTLDFVWSTCALGHIGGYENGLKFIRRSLDLLKPGGIAVHTTELDQSQEVTRFDHPGLSFYKLDDLNALIFEAQESGYLAQPVFIHPIAHFAEKYVAKEPWGKKPHIRIEIFNRELNSVALVFRKPLV